MDTTNLDEFVNAYIECALWLPVGDDDEPDTSNWTVYTIPSDIRAEIELDCISFIAENLPLLSGLNARQCGHDFFLTRNGHGAGFWDRGYGEIGEKLTEACRPYGSQNLSVSGESIFLVD